MNDEELEKLAQRLGSRAAERLDVEATARAVVERLRAEPQPHARSWVWRQPVWLRVAAVLVITLGAGAVARSISRPKVTTPALVTAAGAELNDLSADQLRDVLEAVGQPAAEETVSPQEAGLDDLSAPQLRALLESLEG